VPHVRTAIKYILSSAGMNLVSIEHDQGLDGKQEDELIRHAKRSLSAIGVTPKVRTKASCTEAALYTEKGAQAFVFGPGRSIGNVHRPNEYNEVPQLEKATRFYHQMIRTFAEGTHG
jgi:acetylornithine deacetylase/succinyl-diaminopimelate desuccinylase-like protein